MEFTTEELQRINQEFGSKLIQLMETSKKLKELSSEEIGKLLFYHVWTDLDPLAPQSGLLLEAIERLGFIPPEE